MREKFAPVRPVVSNWLFIFSTGVASSSSNLRNGCTIADLYLSRFSSIQALRLLFPNSRKNSNVSLLKTGFAVAMAAPLSGRKDSGYTIPKPRQLVYSFSAHLEG